MALLNIPDPQIWLAYVLSIAASLWCVLYGIKNWNND